VVPLLRLQVLNRANMRWVRLAAPPGSFILNTGDYMQRISNDTFPSTTHRVSVPVDRAAQAKTRVSFPLNFYLPEETMLAPLPCTGPPVSPNYTEPISALRFHTSITEKYYGEGYGSEEPSAADAAVAASGAKL
jgi:isopenicillin N synthase-like dioxygenase